MRTRAQFLLNRANSVEIIAYIIIIIISESNKHSQSIIIIDENTIICRGIVQRGG